MNRDTGAYVEQCIPMMHLLIDLSDITKNPPLGDMRKLSFVSYESVGWTIFVGANPMLKFFSSVVIQFAGVRYRMMDTHKEALDFLQKHDPSLPSLSTKPD